MAADQRRMPAKVPRPIAIFSISLATRECGCISNGFGAWRILCWVLLGDYVAAFRSRRHELDVGRNYRRFHFGGKTLARGSVGWQNYRHCARDTWTGFNSRKYFLKTLSGHFSLQSSPAVRRRKSTFKSSKFSHCCELISIFQSAAFCL